MSYQRHCPHPGFYPPPPGYPGHPPSNLPPYEGYQGYFNQGYPPPQAPPQQYYYYDQHHHQCHDDRIGCGSFLRGCLAALCCCCMLEECCCFLFIGKLKDVYYEYKWLHQARPS